MGSWIFGFREQRETHSFYFVPYLLFCEATTQRLKFSCLQTAVGVAASSMDEKAGS